MSFYILIFTFLFGSAVGSFLNVWSRRLLRGQSPTGRQRRASLLAGRSRCEHCGHVLSASDLIPLISFLFLCGRCRYCQKPLSWQYPIVELGTGLLFAAFAFKFSPSTINNQLLAIFPLLLASSALIVIFITDLKKQVIFDQTLWIAFIAALLYRIFLSTISANSGSALGGNYQLSSIIYDFLAAFGAFAFFWSIRFITRGRGMGEGDAPLAAVAGLLVGFPQVLVSLFVAFTFGGLVGLLLILLRIKHLKDRIAFGPFLVGATFLTLFAGEWVLDKYLNFLRL